MKSRLARELVLTPTLQGTGRTSAIVMRSSAPEDGVKLVCRNGWLVFEAELDPAECILIRDLLDQAAAHEGADEHDPRSMILVTDGLGNALSVKAGSWSSNGFRRFGVEIAVSVDKVREAWTFTLYNDHEARSMRLFMTEIYPHAPAKTEVSA
jgi:hypothetical protein